MMNYRFAELPAEKQMRIINAGFKVFGESEYKRASTDRIAAEAGISKGYLFYYFRNKKEFYVFLYERALEMIKNSVLDPQFLEIRDFFELMEYAAAKKYEMLAECPFIMDFAMRAFYSKNEDISDEISGRIQDETARMYGSYFNNIDYSKFKDGVDPSYLMKMLQWMADGYMHEQQRLSGVLNLGAIMSDYKKWAEMFKKIAYREEYRK